MKKSKTFTNYYFARFATINLVTLISLLTARFFLNQELHILIVYILILFGLAIYARINFELHRPYAGIGATLLIFWIIRFVLIYTVKVPVGVFAQIDSVQSQIYYENLTNLFLIEATNLIGGLGVFFLIFDMYMAVKKIDLPKE